MLLLSMNVPHPKIDLLPTLLQQSFQVVTIAFAELNDRKASARLSNAKTKHVLFGPVSGPVVLMKIRQIEKELLGETNAETGAEAGVADRAAKNEDSGGFKVEGKGSGADQGAIVFKGQKAGPKNEALQALMKALGNDSATESTASDSLSATSSVPSTAPRSQSAINESESESDSTARAAEENGASGLSQASRSALREALSNDKAGSSEGDARSREVDPSGSSNESPNSAKSEKDQLARKAKVHAAIEDPENPKRVTEWETGTSRKQKANESASGPQLNGPNSSLIKQCLVIALREVCGKTAIEGSAVGRCRFAKLVTISSQTLSASILVSSGRTAQRASDVVDRLTRIFLEKLRAAGVVIEDADCDILELDHLSLAEAVLSQSTETLSMAGAENELAALAFTNLSCKPDYETKIDEMVKVQVEDLVSETPLTFEVFLHMPVNQKYIRYLKVGSSLDSNQANRLARSSVKHLFLSEKDSEAFLRYFAINSLVGKAA